MNEEEIFHQALARNLPEERAAYLHQACGGNPALRASVERLLQANVGASGFLDGPAPALIAPAEDGNRERPGTVIGPYKLLEQIGEGGFGVVFMAEQRQPVRRTVALKVVKPGMDTRHVIARFEAERQALALMDHPNIAHVLDAGESISGRPYFVMDLVRGIPITDYCDRNQLTPRQRLELFVPVCQAVQHAHQKGIIHRDIKPTNILVTLHDGEPVVKVIDFGIAKATGQRLTEKTLFTNFAQMIGTPLYMAPEQAELSGLDIDTRSDIYSLGVLLYELLTGTTPFDKERLKQAGYDEIRRIIREEEPPKPSTRLSKLGETLAAVSAQRKTDSKRLGQLIQGDLDWIVMKALDKDRRRRYQTAVDFAADVLRYLQDEPVSACPPSAWYRFRKFARRNRAVLMTGTAALVLAVAAVVASGVFLWREKSWAQEALHQTRQAQQVEELARRRVERSLYYQSIARADLEWWNNNVGRADQILDECPTEYRHWEWRYLKQLCHADLVTLQGHRDAVYATAFSPDGRRLASASADKSVKIWDLVTGTETLTFSGHKQIASCVAFSADGRLAVSGGGFWEDAKPGELKVWDPTTGRQLFNLTGYKAAVVGVALSPDSKRVAAASWDGTVRLWDLTTGEELNTLRGHHSSVKCVAFSPNGQFLASGAHDQVVILWEAASGQLLRTLRGHSGDVISVAFAPDSQRLVSGGWDETLRVWDVASGREVTAPVRHRGVVAGVAFSPDGERVASACDDGGVKVWQAATGRELATFRGHSGEVAAVAFSPGGRCLASASFDHTVKVWDLAADQQGLTFSAPTRGGFRSALSPDGRRIAMGCLLHPSYWRPGCLAVYDVMTGREILPLGERHGGFHSAAFSPDGQRLAADWDAAVKIWEADTGREIFTLAGHLQAVSRVAFSPDGRRLASAGEDRTVKLWDAKAGREILTLVGHGGAVTSVAFSPDGQCLASGSKDQSVKIWDAGTGRELFTLAGHDALVRDLAFALAGDRLASASDDRTVRVWDPRTGQEILTLPGHAGAVRAVAFSPDGQRLASASEDGSVRIWDAATGQEALTLRRQLLNAYSVAFSPDGDRLIASGHSGPLRQEGFKVWGPKTVNLDPQVARAEVLKADGQRAGDLQRRSEGPAVCVQRGRACAARAAWTEAVINYVKAVDLSPTDLELYYEHTGVLLLAGNLEDYRQAGAALLERARQNPQARAVYLAARAGALAPDAGADPERIVQLAAQAVQADPTTAWYLHTLSLAQYRAGRFDEAVKMAHTSLEANPSWGAADVLNWLVLAMAHDRLGHADEARQWLTKAVDWMEGSGLSVPGETLQKVPLHWHDKYAGLLLRREAEALIPKAPEDLSARKQPPELDSGPLKKPPVR